jgi:hypothetical protein
MFYFCRGIVCFPDATKIEHHNVMKIQNKTILILYSTKTKVGHRGNNQYHDKNRTSQCHENTKQNNPDIIQHQDKSTYFCLGAV